MDHLISDCRDSSFDQGLAFASTAARGDDVEPLLRFLQHSLDQLRRVLQVDVDDRAPLSTAIEYACNSGRRLAEAAAEDQETYGLILGSLFPDDNLRPVG